MDFISSKVQYVTSVIFLEISKQLVRKYYENSTGFKQKQLTKESCEKMRSATNKQSFTAERVRRFLVYCNCNVGICISIIFFKRTFIV